MNKAGIIKEVASTKFKKQQMHFFRIYNGRRCSQMSIQKELELSKKYMLKTIHGTKSPELVELSKDNVARVEGMIINDSKYIRSSDPDAEPDGKYGGSTVNFKCDLFGNN